MLVLLFAVGTCARIASVVWVQTLLVEFAGVQVVNRFCVAVQVQL